MTKRVIAGLFVMCAGLVHAELIYKADFSSYSAGNTITANTTGDNDTASSLTSAGTLTGTHTAFNGSSQGMTDGLSLKLGASSFTTAGAVTFIQSKLGTYGAGTALVASFDFYSLNEELRAAFYTTGNARMGTNATTATALYNKSVRVTMVMNQTGSSITLPGTLGSLATGNTAVFYKLDGGSTYTSIGTTTASGDAGGFALASTLDALNNYILIDNVGVWDSVSDTVGGAKVTELAFGTVIPEPTTVGLFVVSFALILLTRRCITH